MFTPQHSFQHVTKFYFGFTYIFGSGINYPVGIEIKFVWQVTSTRYKLVREAVSSSEI